MRKICGKCGGLTVGSSRCAGCARDARRRKDRLYDRAWRQISGLARQRQRYCQVCGSTTDLTVDHVRAGSLASGVSVLCRQCNSRKGDR